MNTHPDHPYLAEAVRRAASPQTEAECRERIAQAGQRAFLSVVKTASELTTARLLFEAQSAVHDLNQRPYISKAAFEELLLAECKRLCKGDMLKAQLLASAALED